MIGELAQWSCLFISVIVCSASLAVIAVASWNYFFATTFCLARPRKISWPIQSGSKMSSFMNIKPVPNFL